LGEVATRHGDPLLVVDARDYAGEGDLWWRCPHEIAYALESRRGTDSA
jgi:hypothetical protein